jgi:hypothetical protein
MKTTEQLYGNVFFELFQAHWPPFWPERNENKWNQEDRFKRYLQRNQLVDAEGCSVVTELANPGETGTEELDYILMRSPFIGIKPPISEVLATCEFKGPARPTLWQFKRNWFGERSRGLVSDIRKQYRRCCLYRGVEHYFACVALLDNLKRKGSTKRRLAPSLEALSAEVTSRLDLPTGAVMLCSTCSFDPIDSDMIMFLWKICATLD